MKSNQISFEGARISRGLSVKDVSEALKIPKYKLRQWERDSSSIDPDTFKKLCFMYGVSGNALYLGKASDLHIDWSGQDISKEMERARVEKKAQKRARDEQTLRKFNFIR